MFFFFFLNWFLEVSYALNELNEHTPPGLLQVWDGVGAQDTAQESIHFWCGQRWREHGITLFPGKPRIGCVECSFSKKKVANKQYNGVKWVWPNPPTRWQFHLLSFCQMFCIFHLSHLLWVEWEPAIFGTRDCQGWSELDGFGCRCMPRFSEAPFSRPQVCALTLLLDIQVGSSNKAL